MGKETRNSLQKFIYQSFELLNARRYFIRSSSMKCLILNKTVSSNVSPTRWGMSSPHMLPAQPCHLSGSMAAPTAWKHGKQVAISWGRAFPTSCWKWNIFSTKKRTNTWEKLWSSRARFDHHNERQVDYSPCSQLGFAKNGKKRHQFLRIKLWEIRSSSL